MAGSPRTVNGVSQDLTGLRAVAPRGSGPGLARWSARLYPGLFEVEMRARGSYKKSAASRQQVLDAAVRALAEKGYSRTSVSDIAAAAGMSKGAVHYHFESKDDLIVQVLDRCAVVMAERVQAAWDTPGAPAEKIAKALGEMRASRQENVPELRVLADLMAQGLHDPKLRTTLAAMFEANRRLVVKHLISSLEALGLEPKVPVQVLPRLLLGALDGLALHDFFDPPSPEDDAALQRALETIAMSLFET
ncbi:MAG: TetR/AcrR family transcriptional regulator [Sorangiineae bacterium]|nr:TetR/AcrR family transcriptional regulator [Polyangiaceae bacterium]MEB2321667.1 TetR/AcrR family transcriptional regulator [Sorangiineae bacterium]